MKAYIATDANGRTYVYAKKEPERDAESGNWYSAGIENNLIVGIDVAEFGLKRLPTNDDEPFEVEIVINEYTERDISLIEQAKKCCYAGGFEEIHDMIASAETKMCREKLESIAKSYYHMYDED